MADSSNNAQTPSPMEGRDEVDFIVAKHNNNNEYGDLRSVSQAVIQNTKASATVTVATATATATTTTEAATATPNNEPNSNTLKKSKERRTLFHFGSSSKKLSQSKSQDEAESTTTSTSTSTAVAPLPPVPIGTPPRQHKFVKSNSLARLLGNTYNAKKFEKQEQKRLASGSEGGKFNTYSGRRGRAGPYLERFKRVSKEDGDIAGGDDSVRVTNVITLTTDSRDLLYGSRQEHVGRTAGHEQPDQLSSKAIRTLTRSLGKLWKRTHSVDISTPDPEFKVSYLGNVLTGWAKAGEGCVEKQLNTLWRNYTQHSKPDVIMRLKVCASGLKATTRQHGLTEYWAHRITYCCAPKNYPRVFCWIYRHEGRKLKHELRCHAVLCSKEKIAQDICDTLRENLESALREFKREKILKQNARLSLANAVYDNPSLPRRKIMLSVGGNNYRPPLERSKSAPKLMAIEEAIGEEEGDEIEDTNEPEMKPCCQKDSLYPAMTLGRRRCRRGHSIRRTGKIQASSPCCSSHMVPEEEESQKATASAIIPSNEGSDSDDFEKLLKFEPTLSTELLPYFDMQLNKQGSQSMLSLRELKEEEEDGEPLSLLPTINSDPSADPEADYANEPTLRRSGVCSDGEEDFLDDADEDHYFRHAAMLTMLHRSSMRKMRASDQASMQYRHQAQSSISSNASSSTTASSSAAAGVGGGSVNAQGMPSPDSDEGSISSGCETASTVTNANHEEYNNAKRNSDPGQLQQGEDLELEQAQAQVLEQMMIYQRLEQQLRHNSSGDATNYSSSSSITLKHSDSGSDKQERSDRANQGDDSDSDESGYVEFQEKEKEQPVPQQQQPVTSSATLSKIPTAKPKIPPKPAPRRSLSLNVATAGSAASSAGKAPGTAV
ncbi:uncharacterized protein Dana_GF17154, isoform A [Drosophila ananassae]|uniref:Uncharacterized protein, isoform A n=1 Tax=Drosophila ananassae TaxID=7217 RepID=B3M1C1_DROAN|nr:uncharacterized protein LOC6499941 isoform X1 [Drosophila ananassae]EDV42148.1 uncharacterized protein Dana_GF17154, isoform A [Drosophila ananassae]